eukprot:g59706.t1
MRVPPYYVQEFDFLMSANPGKESRYWPARRKSPSLSLSSLLLSSLHSLGRYKHDEALDFFTKRFQSKLIVSHFKASSQSAVDQ